MAMAAKAPADGYTILVHGSNFIVNPSLYAKIPFDPFGDFAPLTLAVTIPKVIVVHPSVPANSVKELIALVKANLTKYSYAHPSTGTTPHLAGELFKLTFDLDLVTVPFNGAGLAVQSTIAGHTPIAFLALPPVAPPSREACARWRSWPKNALRLFPNCRRWRNRASPARNPMH